MYLVDRVPALLLLALGLFAPACGNAEPPVRSVLLITLDTTRPDHLSCYGYGRPTTPELDRLAAEGTLFEDAWAQSPETGPSLASVLTARPQAATGVRANAERLDPRLPTLATIAADADVETAAFVSTVLLRKDVSAFDRGFATYDDEMTDPCFGHPKAQRVAGRTVDAALAWLSERERPFFVWVHLYDPHGPYTPPERAARLEATRGVVPTGALEPALIPAYQRVGDSLDASDYLDRYDHEIAYADRELGRLLAAVDRTTTLVAIHADHGEALGEDGYWFRHGSLLHDAALRIPLVIAGPGIPVGSRVSAPFRNLDLAPTLAAAAGWTSAWPAAEGVAWDLATGIAPPGTDERIAEARRREFVRDATGIDTRWKLRLVRPGLDVTWWPGTDERQVSGTPPEREVAAAIAHLRTWLEPPLPPLPPKQSAKPPEDVPDALKGLGYR